MKKILIVNANYYQDISFSLMTAATNILNKSKIKSSIINVPGVFEIPFTIRKNIKNFDGFIALGCVIKGETPHFDFICRATFDGIMKISIDFNKPVGNGIITALNMKQATKRSIFEKKSLKRNKGLEAAMALVSVLKNEPKS